MSARDLPPTPNDIEEILAVVLTAVDHGESFDLDELCGGDRGLRERVVRLLGFDEAAMSSLSPPAPSTANSSIGEFELISLLGEGGMGRVYLARQRSLQRLVALKVFESSRFEDPSVLARFRREAETTASLEHPNIVPIFGFGENGSQSYIAMRWLTGPGLDGMPHLLSPREVARIGARVARALDHAHRSGVIHRDIKPANLILDHDNPIVVDFGLCRPTSDATLTRPGLVPGTLPYMAPEHFRERDRPLDFSIDTYSLGATLYELVSGHPPFEAPSTEQAIFRILHDTPEPLRLPGARDLEIIIDRALEKDPRRRIESCRVLADELERFLAGEEILSRPTGVVERAWRFARRRPALVTSTLGAVATGTVVALLVLRDIEASKRLDVGSKSLLATVADRDVSACRTILETLQHAHGDAPRLAEHAAQVAALEAEETLIDLMLTQPSDLSPSIIEDALGAVREVESDLAYPPARMAMALGEYYSSDPDTAIGLLDPLASTHPAASVLRHAMSSVGSADLDAEPTDAEPPGALTTSLDAVFLAIAATLSGDHDRAYEVLRRARQDGLQDDRSRFLQARILFSRQRYAEARVGFEFIPIDSPLAPAAEIYLAWLDLVTGDPEGALGRIAAIERRHWTPRTYLIRIDVHRRQGREDLLERELQEAVDRWPRDPQLRLSQSNIAAADAVSHDEEDPARSALLAIAGEAHDAAVRHAITAPQRESARLLGVRLEILSRDLTSSTEGLEARLAELARSTHSDHTRAEAAYLSGQLAIARGDLSGARLHFEAAVKALPEHGPSLKQLTHLLYKSEPSTSLRFGLALLDSENKGFVPPTRGMIIETANLVAAAMARIQPDEDSAAAKLAHAERALAVVQVALDHIQYQPADPETPGTRVPVDSDRENYDAAMTIAEFFRTRREEVAGDRADEPR